MRAELELERDGGSESASGGWERPLTNVRAAATSVDPEKKMPSVLAHPSATNGNVKTLQDRPETGGRYWPDGLGGPERLRR